MLNRALALMPVFMALTFPWTAQTPRQTDQKPATVVRVTTRLVQASVIVLDKDGRPVPKLTRDDFVLQVDGKERKIDTFAEESAQVPDIPPEPLPPGVYSNELARQPGIPHSLTAILFDSLNTQFWDQVASRRNVVEFLSQVKPQDRVAIFSLGRSLRVLHDFSSDSSSLVRAIQGYRARANYEIAAGEPDSYKTGDPVLDGLLEGQTSALAQFKFCERVEKTWGALESIADYMTTVPGRKNLIWVSGNFPFPYTTDFNVGNCRMDRAEVAKISRAISNANMALYPVDARGLVGPNDIMPAFNAATPGMRPGGIPGSIMSSYSVFTAGLQTMTMLADRTGGRAFYNTNDITTSIRRAVDDSSDHYMLGFYSLENEVNRKFHSIRVRVTRPGVEVRYRNGFYALPETGLSGKSRATLATEALLSPLEATRMTLVVRLDQTQPPGTPLRFELVVDPRQLTLKPDNDRMTGSLTIAFLQCTTAGKILQAKQETVNLRLTEATYQSALVNGLSLSREWAAEPGAEQLRIAVCDAVSDNVGSIKVPLPSRDHKDKSAVPYEGAVRHR